MYPTDPVRLYNKAGPAIAALGNSIQDLTAQSGPVVVGALVDERERWFTSIDRQRAQTLRTLANTGFDASYRLVSHIEANLSAVGVLLSGEMIPTAAAVNARAAVEAAVRVSIAEDPDLSVAERCVTYLAHEFWRVKSLLAVSTKGVPHRQMEQEFEAAAEQCGFAVKREIKKARADAPAREGKIIGVTYKSFTALMDLDMSSLSPEVRTTQSINFYKYLSGYTHGSQHPTTSIFSPDPAHDDQAVRATIMACAKAVSATTPAAYINFLDRCGADTALVVQRAKTLNDLIEHISRVERSQKSKQKPNPFERVR